VKARDNCRVATQCLHEHGVPTFHDERPPVPPPVQLPTRASLKPRLIRAPRTAAVDSVYSAHAREGFVFWLRDRKTRGGACSKHAAPLHGARSRI